MDKKIPAEDDVRHELPERTEEVHPADAPLLLTPTDPPRVDATPKRAQRAKRRAVMVANAVLARQRDEQRKGFALEAFIRFGFPLKTTKDLVWEAEDAQYVYKLTGDPEFGLPFGDDFLTLNWITSAFVMLGCPPDGVIRFRSPGDIERAYDPSLGKLPNYVRQRLRSSLERIGGARCRLTPKSAAGDPGRLRYDQFLIIEGADLWFRDPTRRLVNQHTQLAIFPNWLQLSPVMREMCNPPSGRHGPSPFDFDTCQALRSSALAVRLYVWQAWRSYCIDRPTGVPVLGPLGAAQQLGVRLNQRPAQILETMQRAQQAVRRAWRECPNFFQGERFILNPGAAVGPHARKALDGIRRDTTGAAARSTEQALAGVPDDGHLVLLPGRYERE
jgi:hypothetical protein